jgi:hypothetical protein
VLADCARALLGAERPSRVLSLSSWRVDVEEEVGTLAYSVNRVYLLAQRLV